MTEPLLEVMVRDRGEGKTTETILWLLGAPLTSDGRPRRVLICSHDTAKGYILRRYPAMEKFIFTRATWEYEGRRRYRDVEVALDDAENFLLNMFPTSNIKRIMMTGVSI